TIPSPSRPTISPVCRRDVGTEALPELDYRPRRAPLSVPVSQYEHHRCGILLSWGESIVLVPLISCFSVSAFVERDCFTLSANAVSPTTSSQRSAKLPHRSMSIAFRRVCSTSAKQPVSIRVSANQFCADNVATFPRQSALGMLLVELPIRFHCLNKSGGEAGRSLQAYRGKDGRQR
ncbi:hypothetical protein CORC01_01024, partial [Colletotrichum orchidophilum]